MGDHREGHDGHHVRDARHQVIAQCLGLTLVLFHETAQAQRLAETDGSDPVAMHPARQFLPDKVAQVAVDRLEREPEIPRAGCVGLDQRAILHHAVIVDRHRHEDDITAFARFEPVDDIGEQPQFRLTQCAGTAEATFGEHGLGHARLGRHLHVARQHLAVERVVVAAADEVAAEHPDEGLQRPDPRPFPHRIGQRGPVRGQPCDQHVIHVRAVVHHEDDGGILGHALQRVGVFRPDPHLVERARQEPGDTDGEAEIGEGREGGHDLTRVALGAFSHGIFADIMLARVIQHRAGNGGIIAQPHDRVVAPRQLEGPDRDRKALVQPLDRALQATAQIPAHRRHQHPVQRGDRREKQHQDQEPGRDFD